MEVMPRQVVLKEKRKSEMQPLSASVSVTETLTDTGENGEINHSGENGEINHSGENDETNHSDENGETIDAQ